MEWSTWFTGLVGAIGALHLASSAVQSLRGLSARSATDTQTARDDWYVFFRCSTLYGSPEQPAVAQQRQTSMVSKDTTINRPKVAQRPRNRARL